MPAEVPQRDPALTRRGRPCRAAWLLCAALAAPVLAAPDAPPPAPEVESLLVIAAVDPASGKVAAGAWCSEPLMAGSHVLLAQAAGVAVFVQPPGYEAGNRLIEALGRGRPAGKAATQALREAPQALASGAAILDRQGATWEAPHRPSGVELRSGAGYLLLGRLLASPEVMTSAERVFLAAKGSLERRIFAGLRAGFEAGGGKLDLESAVLRALPPVGHPDTLSDARVLDLRVDLHPFPVPFLQSLLGEWSLQGQILNAEAEGASGKWEDAARTVARLALARRTDGRLAYRLAVLLARSGDREHALDALRDATRLQPGYASLAAAEPAFASLSGDAAFREILAGASPGE
jgi:uncharacterized Ntn-hydrolase superfamily protein